jgi:D-alanyl-D-alanine carboxypeptidase
MKTAAAAENVELLIVSGFRSIEYQVELFLKKLAAGISIEDILDVNAAPGFSEHHTGRAVDIATRGARPLTEEFETTPAFAWLRLHAADFAFQLTYDRGNRHGFCYEPWHWSQIAD